MKQTDKKAVKEVVKEAVKEGGKWLEGVTLASSTFAAKERDPGRQEGKQHAAKQLGSLQAPWQPLGWQRRQMGEPQFPFSTAPARSAKLRAWRGDLRNSALARRGSTT